jgi:chemotaxis response regulator CheB
MREMIKVMVVDDSALVRQTMQTILPEKEGFIVVTASTPCLQTKKW